MPKAFPNFEDTAERFLDGELTARQEKMFLNRIQNNSGLKKVLREMKFAAQSSTGIQDGSAVCLRF